MKKTISKLSLIVLLLINTSIAKAVVICTNPNDPSTCKEVNAGLASWFHGAIGSFVNFFIVGLVVFAVIGVGLALVGLMEYRGARAQGDGAPTTKLISGIVLFSITSFMSIMLYALHADSAESSIAEHDIIKWNGSDLGDAKPASAQQK